MNVEYSDSVKRSGEDYTLIQQATKRLEEIIKESSDKFDRFTGQQPGQLSCEWDRTEDEKGEVRFTLRLKDSTGDVAVREFAPGTLRSPPLTAVGLYLIRADINSARDMRQLEALFAMGGGQ